MSIEFYHIEDMDGRKVVHYHGYLDHDDGGWRSTEASFCGLGGRGTQIAYIDVMGDDKELFIAEQLEGCQQYSKTLTDGQAATYLENWGGEVLHINDVTSDTPIGAYRYEMV